MLQTLKKLVSFRKKISLVVIYVEYDAAKNGTSENIFGQLQGYLQDIKGCRTIYLRVDNKREDLGIQKINRNVYKIGGDNSFREFSGWQKGIDALNKLKLPCDLVLITNEMFLKPGPSFLQDYAKNETLQKSLHEKKIIGRIDTAHQQYKLFGYDVSSWICSNCFFVPKKAIDKLENFVLIDHNTNGILKSSYDPAHLLVKKSITTSEFPDGFFSLEINIPTQKDSDIRVSLSKSFAPNEGMVPESTNPLGFMLKDMQYNGGPCPHKNIVRGINTVDENQWAKQAFLLRLPAASTEEVGKLLINGFIPPNIFKDTYENEVTITIWNDSILFNSDAPINDTYKRWLVEWLTERWHSKFEINQETWAHFKMKAAAIMNESLLTAKFSELGYSPVTYGDKQYY